MKIYYRFYLPCAYFLLDNWLCRMSKNGLHLFDYGLIKYVFREGTPSDQKYFTYSDTWGPHNGEYLFCLSLYHPVPEKKYGKQISPQKVHDKTIVLVDPRKIDKEYYIMKRKRNRLYAIRCIIDFIRIVGGAVLLIFLWYFVK